MRATQLKIQASSAWARTWDWLKMIDFFGSMPGSHIGRGHFAGRARKLARSRDACGNGVQVHDAEDRFHLVLQGHPAGNRAEIVAEMEIAGRLNAGKDTGLERRHDKSLVFQRPVGRARVRVVVRGLLRSDTGAFASGDDSQGVFRGSGVAPLQRFRMADEITGARHLRKNRETRHADPDETPQGAAARIGRAEPNSHSDRPTAE